MFDFTGAAAAVAVAVPLAANTNAQMMFTIPMDASNHYRMHPMGGKLHFQKKIANVKTAIRTPVDFDAAGHVFWRIRHTAATDTIAFEVAPRVGGTPGGWTVLASASRELSLAAVKFELKAGTSEAEANPPGTVAFDSFSAVG